jgi:hypothetical protein
MYQFENNRQSLIVTLHFKAITNTIINNFKNYCKTIAIFHLVC